MTEPIAYLNNEQEPQQIVAVIEQYRRGFATLDVETLKDIWDQEYDNIIYIAQELAEPVQGWLGVEQYYNGVVESLERVNLMTISDLSINLLGGIAFAFCMFHFEGEVKGESKPRIADGRNTFILRYKEVGWKVIHFHESCPGSLHITSDSTYIS
jgi:ketosteroid isomerase-like protein